MALITDGRFSGGTHGFVVGHISPEAHVGGPLALLKNGDRIIIDAKAAQLNVNVRPTDLASIGVGIDQVVNALRAQNLAAPVGAVNSALEQRSIRLEGRLQRPEDFNSLVISQRNGQLITLGQVATVEAGAAEPKSAALYNGVAAIGLDIVKSREYSTTAVAAARRVARPPRKSPTP